MGRTPCCSKIGLHKGPWTPKEDALLIRYIQAHGEGQWRSLPRNAGLLRCGKSCRLRWMNYLRPDIKRGNITPDEEDLIIKLHGLLGNRWSLIAKRLPGRTDNEIKNYWNTHLKKKLRNQGTEPNTHKQLPSEIELGKSANGKIKRSRITMNNHANTSKAPKPHGNYGDDKDEVFMEIKIESTTNEDERERSKIHLPKPVRVSPIISLNRNNSIGSFEANYVSAASSGSSISENPNEELAFEPENGILDMPWFSSNTNLGGQNGLDHMIMIGSSSSGDDVNVDVIWHHDRDHHYEAAPPDNKNQPFENLCEEFLQLIKADQYHDVDDCGDHLDSFTKSLLI